MKTKNFGVGDGGEKLERNALSSVFVFVLYLPSTSCCSLSLADPYWQPECKRVRDVVNRFGPLGA